MIIINSDDFGYSKSVNIAIYNSFKKNLISSTTTLVNFEDGFRDAMLYIKEKKIKKKSVGIHFNLTEGHPLTDSIKLLPFFCTDGEFNGNARKRSIFYLNNYEKQVVYEELKAQLMKFIVAFGQNPSHIDSHHHVHTEWAIGTVVHKIAKEFEIKKIRICRNIGEESNQVKKYYRRLYNLRAQLKGFSGVNIFGDIVNMKNVKFSETNKYEIMVHAIYRDKEFDEILDLDYLNLEDKLKRLFKKNKWNIYSYSEI